MAGPLTDLEKAVMQALLAGADPRLAVLRDQLSAATVAVRKFTGVGFFTEFFVPASAARLTEPINNPIGDLFGELDGVDDVGGFLLWLEDGALHILEGVSYGHTWAENAELRRLYYTHVVRGSVVEVSERDLVGALGPRRG